MPPVEGVTELLLGEAWFWQRKKIAKLREKKSDLAGTKFNGRFYAAWEDNNFKGGLIVYIKVKPFIWRHLLEHEREHARISQSVSGQSTSRVLSKVLNAEFDHEVKHGLLDFKSWINVFKDMFRGKNT